MSFFGLTAFGPENFFMASKVNSNGFTLFSDEDFKFGFEKVCSNEKNKTSIEVSEVKFFLHHTFDFPPLDEEVKTFIKFSGKSELSDTLKWDEVLIILFKIRQNLTNVEKTQNYSSHQQYCGDTFKHKRKETSPADIFKKPLTYGQTYGFYKFSERNLNEIKFPKKKCEETKFAEIMIMTGKQIMK